MFSRFITSFFQRYSPLLLIALSGVFLVGTIRSGHDWGCDFSLYIAHARNLVEGRPYSDTGYIYNPYVPSLSPRTYPPGLPLLLTPVYAVFGLDLTAMKVELVGIFLLFLGVFYYSVSEGLPDRSRLGALAFVAFSPVFWLYKDRVLSEYPFMLFLVCAHSCLKWYQKPELSRRQSILSAGLAGVFVLAACLTRSVGIVFIPALLAFDILTVRRPRLVSLIVLAIVGVGIGIQRAWIPPDASYLDQFGFDLSQFISNQIGFAWAMHRFFDNGYYSPLSKSLMLGVTGLIVAGFVRCCKERFSAGEMMVVFYAIAIAFWPSSGGSNRFLFPLVPFAAVYACWGWGWLAARMGKAHSFAGFALLVLLLGSQVSLYSSFDFGPIREGVETPDAQSLFAHLRQASTANDVVIFYRPRALALYTGQAASIHHQPGNDEEMWNYLRSVGAKRVVLASSFGESYRYLKGFTQKYADDFVVEYTNDHFQVLRIRGDSLRASR